MFAGSTADKHDVFVDKEKRTWVSNLAAIQIMSPTDFNDMAELIASHRSSSSAAHSMSHGPGSCIITLLVTADLPSVSVSHGSLPSSARGQKRNSPRAAAAASNSAVASDLGLQRGSLIGHASVQRGDKTHNVHGTTQSCIKLSFVEVGCAAPETRQAARRASAEPLQHMQLSRTSTSLSSFVSMSSTTSSRWAGPGSGTSPRRVGMGAGKGQDGTMRAVAEVVWAAAHAKGVPVPHRQCKLTRYLQDTLHPEGELCELTQVFTSELQTPLCESLLHLNDSEAMGQIIAYVNLAWHFYLFTPQVQHELEHSFATIAVNLYGRVRALALGSKSLLLDCLYLADTCMGIAGRAVAIVCLDPSAGDPAQSASMATLSISERMMLP